MAWSLVSWVLRTTSVPTGVDQRSAYDEAHEVFEQLGASVRQLQDVDVVARNAAELLGF